MKTLHIRSKYLLIPLSFFSIVIALTGCGLKTTSAIGFRLPQGDKDQGKQAFKDLQCASCHSVQGVALGTNTVSGHLNIALGGETLRVRTYGELVTSIINPSHVISAKYKEQLQLEGKLSSMPDFSKSMTVRQMIDLVAFLQPLYHLPVDDTIVAH